MEKQLANANVIEKDLNNVVSPSHAPKLKELPATAICGNDITSSCLYVSALAIIYAGQLAWVALLIVGLVLFLFRRIYGEVVGAMPLNGGAYNALLNTTSKRTASLAACLTLFPIWPRLLFRPAKPRTRYTTSGRACSLYRLP
jgi:hypothetical protein